MEIRKAVRRKAKLRLGISAPSGAGKTYSSLLMASGLGSKIGFIDTENGSGDLYSSLLPGGYDIITLSAPYTPERYQEALRAFESAGYDVVIIDSLSHAWAGSGGALEKQGKVADKSGNSYAAWRQVTPGHNALVDAILQSPCHVIVTLRAKTEYVQEKNEQGKTVVRKVGMSPVMRDGIEYEFTVFMEMDTKHEAQVSKDRTTLFDDSFFRPSAETGKKLLAWFDSAEDAEVKQPEKHPLETVDKTPIEAEIAHMQTIDNFAHFKNYWARLIKTDTWQTFTNDERKMLEAAKDDRKDTLSKRDGAE